MKCIPVNVGSVVFGDSDAGFIDTGSVGQVAKISIQYNIL